MNIDVRGLTLTYGSVTAVEDLDLEVADGEAMVLLGQSGCGKTSTMRCIAGLETPAAGTITIGGETVFDSEKGIRRPPHKRHIGMVFQSYAIWPHMTVFDNVAFPLKMEGLKRNVIRSRVAEVLDIVGLASYSDRGASLLSGGQMQRVALARSLVMRPSVLLLDEPLSNLDARLRDRLRVELRQIQARLGLTCIYVTHDQQEALALADKIALMDDGHIVQTAAPEDVYRNPVDASVAEFLGVGNILPCTVAGDGAVAVEGLTDRLAAPAPPDPAAGDLRACIRAEDMSFCTPGDASTHATVVDAQILVVTFQGSSIRLLVRAAQGAELSILAPKTISPVPHAGDQVHVAIPPDAVQILPARAPRP